MIGSAGNRLFGKGRVQAKILNGTRHGVAEIGGEQGPDVGYREDVRIEIEDAIKGGEELAELQPQQRRRGNVIEERYVAKPVLDVMHAQAMRANPQPLQAARAAAGWLTMENMEREGWPG